MTYSDGLVIRCPCCGMLNIILAGTDHHYLIKCLNCESSILPADSFIFKQGSNPVIP